MRQPRINGRSRRNRVDAAAEVSIEYLEVECLEVEHLEGKGSPAACEEEL
jgi:hypothetical protein